MNCVSHLQQGLWVRDDTRQLEYTSFDPWLELARLLERGRFDALFLADVVGVYDVYKGGPETALREAMQVPANDPMLLVPALATVTEHLGLAFTSSVYQAHPFVFARQLSTLDHLTRGRVAWNIVASYLPNGAANLGFDRLPEHDARYDLADEYLEVCYKLWEGSWEEDAVVADRDAGVYADPAKVHPIDHHGTHYDVAGPHLSEPSPQRTPLLFQAGTSDRGRKFCGRHAECAFIVASRDGLADLAGDVGAHAVRNGRRAGDVKLFQALTPIIGGTEAEARAKADELLEQVSTEGGLAHLSGAVGVDLGTVDPDRPLDSFEPEGIQGFVKRLIDGAPPGTRTFRDLVRANITGRFTVGSAGQIADYVQTLFEAGIDGFNLVYTTTPGSFVDFIDGVVPILQDRGVVQREYIPGPLRQKLFGRPRLPDRHPAAAYRRD
jgi:FMN-dependent oxidoreductase (nitrilotriacetate monooxygenase family)